MAHATVKGARHAVRVVQDLADNWSLEVYPERPPDARKRDEPFKNWAVPLVLKLRADSAAHALVAGLEHMKKLGAIDDFHVDESEKPPPPPPPAAKPAPAAAPAKPAPPAGAAAATAAKPVAAAGAAPAASAAGPAAAAPTVPDAKPPEATAAPAAPVPAAKPDDSAS